MGSCGRIVALGIVLSLVIGGVIGGRASAAPQILGLVATTAPTPLTCSDGMCSAQFSAFCLQQHRISPTAGTAYRPAKGTALTLSQLALRRPGSYDESMRFEMIPSRFARAACS